MAYHYDPKRYKIAPWAGRFGDQAHALRVHPHVGKIPALIEERKREMRRLEEQIRQLEVLKRNSGGTIIDGILVGESAVGTDNYGICLVDVYDRRSAKVYRNAHNRKYCGLHIYVDGHSFLNQEWRGSGHTLEQAIEGARAWVLRKERLPFRVERKDGTVSEQEGRWPR